jgi:hypothetical protein
MSEAAHQRDAEEWEEVLDPESTIHNAQAEEADATELELALQLRDAGTGSDKRAGKWCTLWVLWGSTCRLGPQRCGLTHSEHAPAGPSTQRRSISKADREQAANVHRTSVLCLLARCRMLELTACDAEIQASCLHLLFCGQGSAKERVLRQGAPFPTAAEAIIA